MKIKNYSGRNFRKKRMKDKLTVRKRSALMAKIKSRSTEFELSFFKRLRRLIKIKFIPNFSSIRGKPDIVFIKQKVIVFLDSDFWHGWQFNRWKHLLKNEFWRKKIRNNKTRDRNVTQYLRRHDWKVLRFWEHEINRNIDFCIKKIKEILDAKY